MPAPLLDVRRTELPITEKLPTGLDALVHRAHGRWKSRSIEAQKLYDQAQRLYADAAALEPLREDEIHARMLVQRQRLRRLSDSRWAEGFAEALPLVAELARRHLRLRPYPVQLMGALGLARAHLVEMATGEGKTLTIGLAATLMAWRGRPLHVVTANDYLAQRDAETNQALFAACGVRAASVGSEAKPEERKAAYTADIVYTTSKEIVADFLRDRIVLGELADPGRRTVAHLIRPRGAASPSDHIVQRGLHTAIVDEADNQLIDEAVTPLIISRPQEDPEMV